MGAKGISLQQWLRAGLFSLVLVAVYGTVMRYKIVFNLPFLEQKNLLHAHSHFAFSGWISHFLYTALALLLESSLPQKRRRRYHWLIALNMICAVGMLLSFTVQGYKVVSIAFSTSTVIIAVVYALSFLKDAKLLPAGHPSRPWAIAGLLLNVLSSAGPFSLAYMMATRSINANLYLGSVYYYLHLQYSGWFFFGCMALAAARLPAGAPSLKRYFPVFAATVIPTLGLSLLWTRLPVWLYVVVVAATFIQLIAWLVWALRLFRYFKKHRQHIPEQRTGLFFYASAIALTLKFTLQAVSVVPSLSQLVFGFRPIVIAYLHLVLLGVYSLFIIGYLFDKGGLKPVRLATGAAFMFLLGVLLNELLLAVQGFAAFAYVPVPYINELLLAAAFILLCSAATLACSQFYGSNTGALPQ